jgi:hypothetical protein
MNNMDNQELFKQPGKKSPMSMLEYCKLLLTKVEFDEELVQKEYHKGIKYLNQEERIELMRWIHRKEKK